MADDWLWCGYPHHFIGGADCHFSLATFVGGGQWLVSTVGDYQPYGKQESIGLHGELFETMVFATDPSNCTDGEPTVTSWFELVCHRYEDAESAARGHLEVCNEYDKADRG